MGDYLKKSKSKAGSWKNGSWKLFLGLNTVIIEFDYNYF
ncbi:hypothetical protein EMIT036CA2_10435 [Chryseobacterium sp. IT-36CA2]